MQKDAKSSASAPNAHASRPLHPGQRTVRRNRLRKSRILRGYESFTRVLSTGRSLSNPPIRLFFRISPRATDGISAGFAVTRNLRSAVQRNKVRRMMKEAFRLNQDLWDDGGGVEAVWMYVGHPGDVPQFGAIQDSIRKLMKKAITQTPQ